MADNFENMAGHLLRRCHQIAVAIFLDECAAYDLTPLQFVVRSSAAAPPSVTWSWGPSLRRVSSTANCNGVKSNSAQASRKIATAI